MKLSAILAFSWLVIKVVLLQLGIAEETYGIGLNLFFIVLIIFLAIRKLKGERSFIPLVKAAMRPAAFYVICASIAIFLYYQFLDPGYLPAGLDRVITDEQSHISEIGGFEVYKKTNEGILSATEAEHLQVMRESFGGFISIFSPYGRASIALVTLTFFALFYTLFMVSILLVADRYLKK